MQDKPETEKKSIYRKEALERLSEPEQLNDYIRVTTPGVWVVMIALVSALLGLLAWGVFGRVTLTKEVRGVLHNGGYLCFAEVETADVLEKGMQAFVDGREGTVVDVVDIPLDQRAMSELYSGYLLYELGLPEYVYMVILDIPGGEGLYGYGEGQYAVFDATIITQRVRPISFVFGGV